MRELLTTVGTLAAALAIVAAVVFGARDGEMFVPPPEALAEDFARALAKARYDVAHRYLSSDTRTHQSAHDLRARFEAIRTRLGAFEDVETSTLLMETERAAAAAEIRGARASTSVTLVLIREKGLWTIQHWEAGATMR